MVRMKSKTVFTSERITTFTADGPEEGVKGGVATAEGEFDTDVDHSLRHASVSLLIASGLQAFHIKDIIGHSSVKTTMDVYGHLFPEDKAGRTAMFAVSDQFAVAIPASLTRQGRDIELQVIEK